MHPAKKDKNPIYLIGSLNSIEYFQKSRILNRIVLHSTTSKNKLTTFLKNNSKFHATCMHCSKLEYLYQNNL